MIYIDTSAFLAVLDADDKNHVSAGKTWEDLINKEEPFICGSPVLIETNALVQHRLGVKAVKIFHEDIFPILSIEWADESVYRAGMSSVLTAAQKKLSLVDCMSFEIMRRLGVKRVFAFDKHFKEQGFQCLPA